MEIQPFCRYGAIFAPKPLAQIPASLNPMKEKIHQNPKSGKDDEAESDISTELSVSCEFEVGSKKPRTSTTSYSSAGNKEPVPNALVVWTKNRYPQEEVSTALKLCCESLISTTKKRKIMQDSAPSPKSKKPLSYESMEAKFERRTVASNIARMRFYTQRDESEERFMGVSTKLKMYEDPWKIKKKLTDSDLNNLCRLLGATNLGKNHVLPFLTADHARKVESNEGARVSIRDHDTWSEHLLTLKRWNGSKSYIFNGKWKQEFVDRRHLRQGDLIGLFWDPYDCKFNFRVLERASSEQSTCSMNLWKKTF